MSRIMPPQLTWLCSGKALLSSKSHYCRQLIVCQWMAMLIHKTHTQKEETSDCDLKLIVSWAIRVMADNAKVADNGPKQCRTEEARKISSNGGDRESTHKLLFRDARPYSFIDRYRRFGCIHCLCTQDRRVHRAGKMEGDGRNRNINGNHWQSNSYLLKAFPCICFIFGQRVSSTLFLRFLPNS